MADNYFPKNVVIGWKEYRYLAISNVVNKINITYNDCVAMNQS